MKIKHLPVVLSVLTSILCISCKDKSEDLDYIFGQDDSDDVVICTCTYKGDSISYYMDQIEYLYFEEDSIWEYGIFEQKPKLRRTKFLGRITENWDGKSKTIPLTDFGYERVTKFDKRHVVNRLLDSVNVDLKTIKDRYFFINYYGHECLKDSAFDLYWEIRYRIQDFGLTLKFSEDDEILLKKSSHLLKNE